MKNLFFFFVLFLTTVATGNLNAQYFPIPMEIKIAESELIVEGRVSAQKAFSSNGHIFTENMIEIHQVIKGNQQTESASVITLGGQIGDTVETWTHTPTFSQNEYGIFFLKPTKRPVYEKIDKQKKLYDVFSGEQGAYRVSESNGRLRAASVLEQYNLESLYQELNVKRNSADSPFNISARGMNCLSMKIVPNFEWSEAKSATSFEADIFIKATEEPVDIYSINVLFSYDTTVFGSNIVSSGNLTFESGELVTSYYSLDFEDFSANQIQIVYEADGTDSENLEEVGTEYRKLATITLELEGWSNEDPIS